MRSALFLVPIMIVLGMVAIVVRPQAPWPEIIIAFAAFGILWVALSINSDRKLIRRNNLDSPPWVGRNASSAAAFAATSPEKAISSARAAVSLAGGYDVEVVADHIVIGWQRFELAGLTGSGQWQLAIVVSPTSDGRTQFTCCARPRFTTALVGRRRSEQLVSVMTDAVADFAGGTQSS